MMKDNWFLASAGAFALEHNFIKQSVFVCRVPVATYQASILFSVLQLHFHVSV